MNTGSACHNGGGSVEEAIELAGIFIDAGR